MNFTFNKPINKQDILDKYSEETIFSYYFGENITPKKLYRSRIRDDRNPTVGFYRNNVGTLLYHDFATNDYYDCINYVQAVFKCSYHQALKIIANDFGIVSNSNIQKNPGKIQKNVERIEDKQVSKIQVEIQDFSDLELKWWDRYGITPEILKKFNVYSCKHVFLNGNLFTTSQQHCPSYGYYGGKIKENGEKIELWKIYYPKRKQYRFIGNYPSSKLQGYKQLPKKGKICVLTKSLKDVMALYAYNIPACAPNSETIIPKEVIIEDLLNRFEYVFALWDNDETGVIFLNKLKRKYPKLHCIIIPRKLGYKDFSDLRKGLGYKKTKELLLEFIKNFKSLL